MNGLVRWAVTTSLATLELVLAKTLDGVRVANGMLAAPGPGPRQVTAGPARAQAPRGGEGPRTQARPGWRPPERGDLDATSAALRARAEARPVPGVVVPASDATTAAVGEGSGVSRTRPPRRRVVVASASAASMAGRAIIDAPVPRTETTAEPGMRADEGSETRAGMPTTPSRRSASVRLAPAKRGAAAKRETAAKREVPAKRGTAAKRGGPAKDSSAAPTKSDAARQATPRKRVAKAAEKSPAQAPRKRAAKAPARADVSKPAGATGPEAPAGSSKPAAPRRRSARSTAPKGTP